jgi:uncharacterized CHY-type Zn-finger protein
MDLTLAEFVILILAASGALVLASSLISRTLHRRAENRAVHARVICRLCLAPFSRPECRGPLTCPYCKAVNDPGRDGLHG